MKHRRWPGRLGIAVAVAAVAALLAAAAGKLWIIPALLRRDVSQWVAEDWDGSIRIAEVDIRYGGVSYVRGVELLDPAGRTWLRIASARLTIRGWPGMHPRLTGVELDRPQLLVHFVDGECRPPIRGFPKRVPSRHVDIRQVAARNISLDVVRNSGEARGATCVRVDRIVRRGRLRLRFDGKQARLTRGRILIDSLPPGAPDDAVPLVLDNVTAGSIRLADGRLCVEELAAETCKGQVRLPILTVSPGGESIRCDGRFVVERIDLAQLGRALGRQNHKVLTKGAASANGEFSISAADPETPSGRGMAFLDDCDLSGWSLLSYLANRLGINNGNALAVSDAEAAFDLRWPVATIRRGQLASALSAYEAEPGGTVDLRTKKIDVYVAAVPVRQVRQLLSAVPIISLLAEVPQSLVRLRIEGCWDEPPAKLVKIAPPRPPGAATLGFFREAARMQGQLTGGILDQFDNLFKALGKQHSKPSTSGKD